MTEIDTTYLNAIRDLGFDPNEAIPIDVEGVQKAMRSAGVPDEMIEQAIAVQGKTRKEQYDLVLKPIQLDVEADARIIQASWEGQVLVGGLPSHSLNASSQKVNGGYLILVNYELIQLLHQVAKVLVHSSHLVMVSEDDEKMPTPFAERLGFASSNWSKEYAMKAIANIYQCLRSGDISQATFQPTPGCQLQLDFYSELLNYAERFLVSHEFAHVILGHCETDEKLSGIHGIARKRQTELDADQLAVRLMFAALDFSKDDHATLRDAAMRAAGIAFSLLSNWLADCCRDLPSGLYWHDDEAKSYPHFQLRFQNVRSFIKKRYGPMTTFMDVIFVWAWGTVLPVVGELSDNDDIRKLGSAPPAIRFD